MHRTQTARTALCGVLGALGLVLLALGSVLPLATYAAPMLACFLLLPALEKGDLFRGVVLGGVLPRKTFSMGHAEEKRYYIECRRIAGEP